MTKNMVKEGLFGTFRNAKFGVNSIDNGGRSALRTALDVTPTPPIARTVRYWKDFQVSQIDGAFSKIVTWEKLFEALEVLQQRLQGLSVDPATSGKICNAVVAGLMADISFQMKFGDYPLDDQITLESSVDIDGFVIVGVPR